MKNVIEEWVNNILDKMNLDSEIEKEIDNYLKSGDFKVIVKIKTDDYLANYLEDFMDEILHEKEIYNILLKYITKKITTAFK